MINTTDINQLFNVLLFLFFVAVVISIVTRILGSHRKIDWDFCITLPIMLAGYHTVAHSHSSEYDLQALTWFPKLIENDWLHFGLVAGMLFGCIITAEIIGYHLLKKWMTPD